MSKVFQSTPRLNSHPNQLLSLLMCLFGLRRTSAGNNLIRIYRIYFGEKEQEKATTKKGTTTVSKTAKPAVGRTTVKTKLNRKRSKLSNSTGFTGVSKTGNTYQAYIYTASNTHQARIKQTLGDYETVRQAAVAYDRAAVKRGDSKEQLNYPNKVYHTDEVDSKTCAEEEKLKDREVISILEMLAH